MLLRLKMTRKFRDVRGRVFVADGLFLTLFHKVLLQDTGIITPSGGK